VDPLSVTPFRPGLSGWRVLGHRLNSFAAPQRLPGIADIMSRATALSQVHHRHAAHDGDQDSILLLRPPVAGLGSLDFKGGNQLIEVGYRYAAEVLSRSALANASPDVSAPSRFS
jgi:hypothetical protein